LLWLVRIGDQPATALPAPPAPIAPAAPLPTATTARSSTPAAAQAAPTRTAAGPNAVAPTAPAATPTAPPDAVVIVNGAALTPEEFERLLTIDTVMAGLAGHAPSAPGLVLEQWINGELAHRQAMQAASAPVDGADSLAAFLARTGRDRAELDAALAAAQVPQAAFDAYWQRLILADQFVRAAAAAQGIAAADVVRSLQEGARISFGTAASALFATPVTATPVAAGGTDLTAAAPVASGPSTAADRAADAATSNVAISDAAPAAVRGVETGLLAPEFVLGALNAVSPTLSLADLQGRPAVLVFWTTWCPYCLRQTPVMVEAYPRAAEAGIQFVGIDVQEDRNTVATYLAQHRIEYPILLDEQGSIAAQYAVQGYPTTYFLDSDGRIVARNVGALTGEQLNTYLQLLGPRDRGHERRIVMIAGYDRVFPSGYAAAISVELSDSAIEQIRKLVNLLMVFSMLLSMISPIYAPMGFALPSYAFFDGSSAPAAQPVTAQPARTAPAAPPPAAPAARDVIPAVAQPRPDFGAGAAVGAALAPAWLDAPSVPQTAASAAALGTALTPSWLAAPPSSVLAPLAAPWWRDPAAATLRAADLRALAPVADADAIGADLSAPEVSAPLPPETELTQPELGSALAPAWLAAATAAPVAGDLRSELLLPNWAPLAFAAGICAANPEFSWTTSAPISMTMGNNTAVYTFTAVIANNSITPTGPLTYAIQLPPNFTFVSGSATAVSSVSGTLTTVQAGTNTTGVVTLRASATPVSNTLMPGSAVTLTYQLRGGPDGPPNPDVVVNIVSGDASNPNCTVNNPVSTNFCPLAGELALQLTPPPFLISYGNTNGDLYTVTLRNNGSYTMTDVSFEVNPNSGFFFKGGSATGVNSLGDTLTFTQPVADTAEDATFVLRVANPYPASSIAPGETITVVMRLATGNNPKSGQPLVVTARSGSAGAELACTTTRENIATGRGHLYVRKIVEPTVAAVGDPVTFTILLDNTGLGSIYNAEFEESLGSGVRLIPASVVIPDEIKPNSAYSFTVPAEVTSCVGTTNTVSAWWPVGNVNNTATFTNPSNASAAVRVSNPAPSISIQADLPEVTYCQQPVPFTVDVPLTVTNSGQGPAAYFTLLPQDNDNALNFTFSTSTPGWVSAGGVLSYTDNSGLLAAGATANLTLTLTYTPTTVCNANAGAFSVTPSYSDACFPEFRNSGPAANFNLTSPNPPSLEVTKESSIDADRLEIVNPGDTVYFTVTAFGATGDISGTQVHIIDTLPPSLVAADLITVTTPGAVRTGSTVQYTPTITTSPNYSFTLYIQATYPQEQFCANDSGVEENRVSVHSEECTTCLSDDDAVPLVYVDPDPDFSGGSMGGEPIMLDQCRTSDRQTMVISVTHPITWAGTLYNDPLGGRGVGSVNVIPGSVRVFVDNIERTLDVTVTTAPSLTVAFDKIGTVSQTALISITYQVTAPVNASRGSEWYNVAFTAGGRDAACGVTRRAPIFLSIGDSLLGLGALEPDILQSCAVNDVTLTVDGNYYLENVTNQQVATATTSASALLTLVKSVTPTAAAPGQTVLYAITATNSGPKAAAGVIISDSLPASLTVLAVSSTAGGCTSLPCTVGNLAANKPAVVYVVAQVVQTTTGNIGNTAVVTTTTALAAGSDLDASVLLPVTAAADMAIEKSAPITATTGDRITYTLVVVNHGPSNAAGVVVTDTLPAGVTMADDDVCSTAGVVVTCPATPLDAGVSITYTLAVTVNSSAPAGSLLENWAETAATTADPNPANNVAVAATHLSDLVTLTISKLSNPAQVNAGEQVTYTIVVTNAGPGLARDLVVQDALPAGLSLLAGTASHSGVCTDGLCEFGDVAVGATRTMTVVAQVDPGLAPMTATNVVTAVALASTQTGPAAVSADTAITVLVNLTITKVLVNEPLQAGGVAMYRIIVTNTGPSNATGVVVTDTLPVSTTFAGGDAICTGVDRDVSCTVGGLAAGASRSLVVLANVDSNLGSGDSLTNTATISCLTSSAAITTVVVHTVSVPSGTPVNIGITKAGPPAIVAGEQLTYTLVVTNNDTTTATVVSLADALPNGVSLVSITQTQGTCTDAIRCDLGTLTDTAVATITVVGLVASWVPSGTALVNWGYAAAAEPEINANYSNNLTAFTTTVSARALLTLTKHVNANSISPGDRIVYRIVVTNSGPSAAPLTISDSAPISLTDLVVSSSAGGCTSLPCAVASLAPNAVVTVFIAATVAQTVTGALVNSASVTTTVDLVGGSSTTDDVTVNVIAAADVAVAKTATPAVLAGERITYSLVASNRGPSNAAGVIVTDTLASGLTFAEGAGCSEASGVVTCNCGDVGPGRTHHLHRSGHRWQQFGKWRTGDEPCHGGQQHA
jgi:uncharacterized repeat protein (TIGR01451 family)